MIQDQAKIDEWMGSIQFQLCVGSSVSRCMTKGRNVQPSRCLSPLSIPTTLQTRSRPAVAREEINDRLLVMLWSQTPDGSESCLSLLTLWPLPFLNYLFIWLCWVLVAACRTFSCSMWDLVPWPGIKLGPPALGAQSLSHWTTREVSTSTILRNLLKPQFAHL